MRIKGIIILLFSIFVLISSCSKQDIELNKDYLWISDVLHYCNCDKNYVNRQKINQALEKCNNKVVKVKGVILSRNLSYQVNTFSLYDIRNGKNIEIYIDTTTTDPMAIIDKINVSNKSDICFITGELKTFEMPTNFVTSVGIYVLLSNEGDMYFEKR